MSNEKKKQYLRRYLVAKRCAALLLEQIESLRENKMSPSGTLDGMPHGSGTSDLSGYAARLDELMRELEAEREMQMVTYHEMESSEKDFKCNRAGSADQKISHWSKLGEDCRRNALQLSSNH